MLVTFVLRRAKPGGSREMAVVPRKGEIVHLDGVTYRVRYVVWFTDDEPRESDVLVYLRKTW